MRFLAPAIGCLLAGLAVSAAGAAVPNPIASLLGPSIGYLQAQSIRFDQAGFRVQLRLAFRRAFARTISFA